MEGLAKALLHAGQYDESMDRFEEAFLNNAERDSIHPTPLFELMGIVLEEIIGPGHLPTQDLARLAPAIEVAVKNMAHRNLDQDGNAGVLFERMAQALLRCSLAQGTEAEQAAAANRRKLARYLLERAIPLVQECTESGEADLSHISTLLNMEMQLLNAQDATYRKQLGDDLGLGHLLK